MGEGKEEVWLGVWGRWIRLDGSGGMRERKESGGEKFKVLGGCERVANGKSLFSFPALSCGL